MWPGCNAYSYYAEHLDANVGLNAMQAIGGEKVRGVAGQQVRRPRRYQAECSAKNTDIAKLVNLGFFSLRLLMSRPQSMYYLTTGFALAPKGNAVDDGKGPRSVRRIYRAALSARRSFT
jgi:hypothetical protein